MAVSREKDAAIVSKSGVSKDFFVVGSSTLDVLAKTNNVERIDIAGKTVERLVCISFASKSELDTLELHPGGSASNSAIMMKTLGSSVYLLSAVGKDEFGKIVLADLEKNGINSSTVRIIKGFSTGVGLCIVSNDGEKSILIYRGATSQLSDADVPESAIKNCSRVFIASLSSKNNYLLFKKVLELAKKHGKPVIFAPSITMLHSWMPKLRKEKPHFETVIMNYEEGSYYSGRSDLKEILESLPGKLCIITKDTEGAFAFDRRSKKFVHVNSVHVKVIDTTGAGDAFSGAFTAEYYSGHTLQDSLKVAVSAAALKLTHKGAHFSLKKPALDSFMKENKSRLIVRGF